jgi:uncharacterized membrane protein YphA (DoxX/SURF4 family)
VTVVPAIDPAIGSLLAFALAAIFAWSGAMKLADVEMFEGAVANYRLLPRRTERVFARAIPLCECTCAAGLLCSRTRMPGVAGLVLLLCVFTAAIAINLMRGRTNIDCGCFGASLRQRLSAWLLARNAVLVLFAVLIAAPTTQRPSVWLDWVTVAMGAATMVALYASANYALGNAPRTRALAAL